jgi:hypothetical protein
MAFPSGSFQPLHTLSGTIMPKSQSSEAQAHTSYR